MPRETKKDKETDSLWMPRYKKIVKGGIYHIIQRAPGKEIVFCEGADYLYFLHILKKTCKESRLELFSFALLPNHLHLLLKLEEENLPQAMKKIFTAYAMYFNAKYKRKGHVFYGRYRASFCNDERYLITLSVYIHLNPIKAGLCIKLGDYPWSSLNLYLKDKKSDFVNSEYILTMLHAQINEARNIYKNILENSAKLSMENAIENNKAPFRFALEALKFLPSAQNKKIKNTFELEQIDEKIKMLKATKVFKKPQDKEALSYMIDQLKSRGMSQREIAKILGVHRTTIYRVSKPTATK